MSHDEPGAKFLTYTSQYKLSNTYVAGNGIGTKKLKIDLTKYATVDYYVGFGIWPEADSTNRIVWGESERLQLRFFDEPDGPGTDGGDDDDGVLEESGAQITSLFAGMMALTLAFF